MYREIKNKLESLKIFFPDLLGYDLFLLENNEVIFQSSDITNFREKSGIKFDVNLTDSEKFELFLILKEEKDNFEWASEFLKKYVTENLISELENRTLSTELLEKYEELNLIYDFIADVRNEFDEYNISKLLLDKAIEIISVKMGAVVLFDYEYSNFKIIYFDFPDDKIYHKEFEDFIYWISKNSIDQKKMISYHGSNNTPVNLSNNIILNSNTSALSLPLISKSKVLGSLVLIDKKNNQPFNSSDINLLNVLVSQSSESIRLSRFVEEQKKDEALKREMKIAYEIQMNLLPKCFPKTESIDVAAFCHPAEYAGGDYYDFIIQSNNDVIVIADVCGHGLSSSFLMVSLRSVLRAELNRTESLKICFESSNNLLHKDFAENDKFATLFALKYNDKTSVIEFTDAGHPVPIYWNKANRTFENLNLTKSFPLGVFENTEYYESSIKLSKGDIILLYTDGATDIRNEKNVFFGIDGIKNIIRNYSELDAHRIGEYIYTAIKDFQQGSYQKDDITFIVLKVK